MRKETELRTTFTIRYRYPVLTIVSAFAGAMSKEMKKILIGKRSDIDNIDQGIPGNIIIKCGGKEIKVHKLVLALKSEYFRERIMENPNNSEFVFNEFDFGLLGKVIIFMYTDVMTFEKEKLPQVLPIAELFRLDVLVQKVRGMIQDDLGLD